MDDVEIEVTGETGALAFFGGLAGDALFYSSLHAVSAIDYARSHPLNWRIAPEIFASASLSGESLWHIARKVLSHAYLRRPASLFSDPRSAPNLLTNRAAEQILDEDLYHPWLFSRQQLPVGKQYQLFNLCVSGGGLFYTHVFHRERQATSISPLTAQPVVELCLRIPTYALLAGGQSRGLARKAFADVLPPRIAKRTVKGSALSFWHQALRHNAEFLREGLLDGLLVKEGLLDRGKLARYLTREQAFLTVHPGQIVAYLSAEAWLRQSTQVQQRAAA